jgi:hypothetical protein
VNFFSYVQLIQNGWAPDPPNKDWAGVRDALINLVKVNEACRQIDEATRMQIYIAKMDKEYNYVRPVE